MFSEGFQGLWVFFVNCTAGGGGGGEGVVICACILRFGLRFLSWSLSSDVFVILRFQGLMEFSEFLEFKWRQYSFYIFTGLVGLTLVVRLSGFAVDHMTCSPL